MKKFSKFTEDMDKVAALRAKQQKRNLEIL